MCRFVFFTDAPVLGVGFWRLCSSAKWFYVKHFDAVMKRFGRRVLDVSDVLRVPLMCCESCNIPVPGNKLPGAYN